MKSLLLLPAVLCVVPLTSWFGSTDRVRAAAPAASVAYEGKISGWSVLVDGTVAVRVEGTRDQKPFSLWFATPADRTASTRYESLVLQAVLAACGRLDGPQITVVSDSKDSGKSIEDALELSSLSQL